MKRPFIEENRWLGEGDRVESVKCGTDVRRSYSSICQATRVISQLLDPSRRMASLASRSNFV